MEEFLEANKDKLNQTCKKFLQREKVPVSSDGLYCLQLALWAIEDGIFDRPLDDRLSDFFYRLLRVKNQAKVYQFLLDEKEDEFCPIVEDQDLKTISAEDLAWAIWDSIDNKLRSIDPDYPKARVLD
jgi:hypothetical protein